MRLWSLHPKYLDPQGLVALWHAVERPECHPLFQKCDDGIEAWERP